MGLFDRLAGTPPAAAETFGYDFVDVRTGQGVQRMSRSQFEAQALPDRIRILVEGTAVFLRGDVVVPASVALKGTR